MNSWIAGKAASNEPTSGWNLPPGCFDGDPRAPWNREEPKTCGDCSHLLEGCCDYGICEEQFERAFDEEAAAGRCETPWKAAQWALGWVPDHYRDTQEDWCERCDG